MKSLSSRLTAAALVWIAFMLTAGGLVLATAFRDTVERFQYQRLDALLRAVVAAAEVAPDGSITLAKPLGETRFEQVFSGWYWQISDDHEPLARSRSLWDQVLAAHPGPPVGPVQHRVADGPMAGRVMITERDITFPGRDKPLHVLVAADANEVTVVVTRFGHLLLGALGTLGAGLLAAVALQVKFGLKPLRALAEQLVEVRAGRRDRIGGPQPAEVEDLVKAMNAVLDHDAALIERARTHVGNLAHALKTPLAVLKVDHDPKAVADQVAAMDRLVAHHLTRATGGAGPAFVHTDAGPVLSSLRSVIARMHPERQVELTVEGRPVFAGSRDDLEEIAGNLMDNAAKWARARVRVAAGELAGGLLLRVEDDGPGMTAEQAEEAAQRGVRLDEMVPGSGLGLAIVADLVAVHGGTVAFARSDLGGLRVEVRLPG